MKLAFDWGVSAYYGWGVYGLNLALEWSRDADIEAQCTQAVREDQLALDPLRRRAIEPFIRRGDRTGGRCPKDAVMLHTLGNNFEGRHDGGIGVIFFELPLSPAAIERAKRFDVIVTGSTWNEQVLRGHGLTNVVRPIFQGVDRSLFHPAPKRGLFPGKFLIFSGGKAEPRKAQDLVVKAFRAFASRHDDAMLVTAWSSPWPQLSAGMDLNLDGFHDRVIRIGAVPNSRMAPIYRECDVALFPNRAEGGTNLVAMECIACGVPTIVSACTGHDDLLALPGVSPLSDWQPAAHQWDEWGECGVEEIVEALEAAYRLEMSHRATSGEWRLPRGLPPEIFLWSDAASQLAAIARDHQPRSHHHEREDSRKIEA
jgi:glycosyltransferase involved in cell wall biosynthesis